MQFEIKTKQGKTFTVSDDSVWLWVSLERDLGLTYSQAIEKISQESLDVITYILHHASLDAGHTELKTQKAWLKEEFLEFDVVDADPKEPQA